MTVRGDAARRRQCGEELFDARYRGQLAGERDIDMGPERLEEAVRQGTSEPGLDLGGQGDAVLAKTEHHRLVHRDRKIGGDQTLPEYPAEDNLAVDQHPIAIEDDESRQKRSLSGPAVAAYMASDRDLSPSHGTHENDSSAFSAGWSGVIVAADILAPVEETMPITLYDLAGVEAERRFSPFCWRTRMALAHKGLEVETVPWRFTEKDRLPQPNGGRVPVIVDGGQVVHEFFDDRRVPRKPLPGSSLAFPQ